MQTQLRHNSLELQEYLRGLESWEEEVKARDESLRRHKPILKEVRARQHVGGAAEVISARPALVQGQYSWPQHLA